MKIFAGWFSGRKKLLDIEKRFQFLPRKNQGANAVVFDVKEQGTGKRFAIKIVDPKKLDKYRARFDGLRLPTEGQMLQRIDSPYCVKCLEEGVTRDGKEYSLLEFIDGGTLESLCLQKRINQPLRMRFLLSVVEAVHDLHEAGLVHRNICLRNFISDYPMTKAVLIDFALAIPNQTEFLSRTGREGTPLYMAPEIIRRKPKTSRLDLFALGVTI